MKKSLISIYFFLALISLTSVSYAQGFMGRRVAIGYTFGSYIDTEGYTTLIQVHQAEADFIFNRRMTLGLSYTNSGRMYYFYSDPVVTSSDRRVRLTSQGMGFRFKLFRARDGSMAPLGSYYTLKYTPIHAKQASADNRQPEFLIESIHPFIFFGAGRNSIIWNRLLLQFGGEIGGMLFSKYTYPEGVETGFYEGRSDNIVQSRYTFQFKLGVMLIP